MDDNKTYDVTVHDGVIYGIYSCVSHVVCGFLFNLISSSIAVFFPEPVYIGRIVMNVPNLATTVLIYPLLTILLTAFISRKVTAGIYSPSDDKYYAHKNIAIMVAIGEGLRFVFCLVPLPMFQFGQMVGLTQYGIFAIINYAYAGSANIFVTYLIYILIHLATMIVYIPLSVLPHLKTWKKCDEEYKKLTK